MPPRWRSTVVASGRRRSPPGGHTSMSGWVVPNDPHGGRYSGRADCIEAAPATFRGILGTSSRLPYVSHPLTSRLPLHQSRHDYQTGPDHPLGVHRQLPDQAGPKLWQCSDRRRGVMRVRGGCVVRRVVPHMVPLMWGCVSLEETRFAAPPGEPRPRTRLTTRSVVYGWGYGCSRVLNRAGEGANAGALLGPVLVHARMPTAARGTGRCSGRCYALTAPLTTLHSIGPATMRYVDEGGDDGVSRPSAGFSS